MRPQKIVLIVPVYNNAGLTDGCLRSIARHAGANPPAEVLVVDDGSAQETKDCLRAHADSVTVLTNPQNLGYLATTNRGIRHALDEMGADFVVLMNNDLEVRDDWLGRLLSVMDRYDLSGYSNAGKKWFLKKQFHRATPYLEGSCMLVKRAVFEKVGMLDPVFVKGYYSDDDICLRALKEGFSIGLVDNRKAHFVKHLGGKTFGRNKFDYMRNDYTAFMAKWAAERNNPVVANYLAKWMFNPHRRAFKTLEWCVGRFYLPLVDKRGSE